MRRIWSAPGNNTLQGDNNQLLVQMMNTLKSELQTQQNQLLLNHQEEDAVDGGLAESLQFHYLLAQPPMNNAGASISASAVSTQKFDANQGATGTAGNISAISIERTTSGNKLLLGVNKNSATGVVPANAGFISTSGSTIPLSLGRGSGGDNPSAVDIYITSAGLVGIGLVGPVSGLESNTSFGANVTNISTDTTLSATHYTVLVDTTAGNVTITLPAISGSSRRMYNIKKVASANTMTIARTGSDTFYTSTGGNTSIVETSNGTCYQLQADLTNTRWVQL